MSNQPSDRPSPPVAVRGTHPRRRTPATHAGAPDLGDWLQQRLERLAEEWSAEIRVRGMGHATVVDEVVTRQVLQLSTLLPSLLGRYSAPLQPLWTRACELFGTVAAKRGLAAGEVIEEFQILRTLVIRDLYQDPPVGGAPTLRDALRLNAIIDRGVTHASVGHTDVMFFQLLGDSEAPLALTADQIARAADAQLGLIREEVEAVLGKGGAVPEPAASAGPWPAHEGGPADA